MWINARTTQINYLLKQNNLTTVSERVSSVLRPRQHSIGYMGDGFYRSKDPANSIKVLKEMLQKRKKTTKTTKYRNPDTIIYTKRYTQNKHHKSPSLH